MLALRVVAQQGDRLDIGPAIIRWLAFAYWATLLGLVPVLAVIGNWAYTAWSIVLLLTTAMSPVNQGLHDRWAGSAVIRRADARTNPIVIGCLVLALVGVLLFILLPVMALLSITPEMWEDILSQVGDSI